MSGPRIFLATMVLGLGIAGAFAFVSWQTHDASYCGSGDTLTCTQWIDATAQPDWALPVAILIGFVGAGAALSVARSRASVREVLVPIRGAVKRVAPFSVALAATATGVAVTVRWVVWGPAAYLGPETSYWRLVPIWAWFVGPGIAALGVAVGAVALTSTRTRSARSAHAEALRQSHNARAQAPRRDSIT
jgi:hypothetical protein